MSYKGPRGHIFSNRETEALTQKGVTQGLTASRTRPIFCQEAEPSVSTPSLLIYAAFQCKQWLGARRSKNFPEGSELGHSKWDAEEVALGTTMCDMDSEVRKQKSMSFCGREGAFNLFKMDGCLGFVKLSPFQLCRIKGSSKYVCSAIIFWIIKDSRCPLEKLLSLPRPASH